MELYKEILAQALEKEELHILFPQLKINAAEIVELECYKILQKIKAVIEIDGLSDAECFIKNEEIILAFEDAGSGGGARHDF